MGLSSANLSHATYVSCLDDALDAAAMAELVEMPRIGGDGEAEPRKFSRFVCYVWTRDPQYLRLLPDRQPCTWRLRRLTAPQLAEVEAQGSEAKRDLLAFRLAVRGCDNFVVYDADGNGRPLELRHTRTLAGEEVEESTLNAIPEAVWRDVGRAAVLLSSLQRPFQQRCQPA